MDKVVISEDQIAAYLDSHICKDKERKYAAEHQTRFRVALTTIESLLAANKQDDSLEYLDIGPHYMTGLVQTFFPRLRVSTIGFAHGSYYDEAKVTDHVHIDLNTADGSSAALVKKKFDLIYMGELLEHLHCPPTATFSFLANLIRPGGHLIIQTPNAVSLRNRLKMLCGRNPYDIRTTPFSHVREYTAAELRRLGLEVELDPVKLLHANYFESRRRCDRFAPCASLKSGITAIYQRRPAGVEA